MARKNRAPKREIEPDPIYNSALVTRAINKIMYDGKKSKSEKIFYQAMEVIEEKMNKDPVEVFEEALNNVMPVLEVKSRRVGGANYQVPVEVDVYRRRTLGLRWLMEAASKRGEKRMENRLANEIMEAFNNTGGAISKKEEIHRMAEANKAFAHYRW